MPNTRFLGERLPDFSILFHASMVAHLGRKEERAGEDCAASGQRLAGVKKPSRQITRIETLAMPRKARYNIPKLVWRCPRCGFERRRLSN
jgi:hypothetical protein